MLIHIVIGKILIKNSLSEIVGVQVGSLFRDEQFFDNVFRGRQPADPE